MNKAIRLKNDGDYYNMPARYYTYAKEEDFARAGTLLREYKLNELKYVQGISLSLRSWTNKEYWGQEQE